MRAVPLWVVVFAAAAVPVHAQEPTEAEAIAAALRTPVSATFAGTRAALALDELAKQASLNLALRGGADPNAPVTLEARSMTADAVLKQVEQQLKLQRTIWCGALVLHPQGKPLPPPPAVVANPLLDARSTQVFDAQPFLLAIEKLRNRGLTIELTARARARVASVADTITVRVFRMQVRNVLTHLGIRVGLTWSMGQDGKTVTFDNASTREVGADELTVTRDVVAAGPQVDVPRAITALKQPGTRDSARRQLVAAGKRAGPNLAAILKESDASLVRTALQLIGQVEATDQTDAVLAVFRDAARPFEVRGEAGATLGALKANSAVPALIDALNDESFRVAASARNALVSIGPTVVPPLLAKWKPASATPQGMDGLVYGGLLVLGSVNDQTGRDTLLQALKTKAGPRAVPLRHHAAIGLGFTGDPKVVDQLIQALDEERDFLVASYISRSLGWITKQQDMQPQAASWRAWWQNNKKRFLDTKGPDVDLIPDLPKGPDGMPIIGDDKKPPGR